MRLTLLSTLIFASLLALVAGWTKDGTLLQNPPTAPFDPQIPRC